MSEGISIDLSGLEDKWSRSGRKCAICGKDFDEGDDDDDMPLMLWRGGGEKMLTFCWGCAQTRLCPEGREKN